MKSEVVYKMITEKQRESNAVGTFFSAVNITGKGPRIWNCRLGVTKHLRGGSAPYSFKDKNLIGVWDNKAKGYRTIDAGTLTGLRVCGSDLISAGQLTPEGLRLYNKIIADDDLQD